MQPKKIISIFICDLMTFKNWSKTNSRKHGLMFSLPLKKTFDFLGIHLVGFEN
jgi:hypothetical protein